MEFAIAIKATRVAWKLKQVSLVCEVNHVTEFFLGLIRDL